jgi:hypothetical protein
MRKVIWESQVIRFSRAAFPVGFVEDKDMGLNSFDLHMLDASDLGSLLAISEIALRNWLYLEPENPTALSLKKQFDELQAAREARAKA